MILYNATKKMKEDSGIHNALFSNLIQKSPSFSNWSCYSLRPLCWVMHVGYKSKGPQCHKRPGRFHSKQARSYISSDRHCRVVITLDVHASFKGEMCKNCSLHRSPKSTLRASGSPGDSTPASRQLAGVGSTGTSFLHFFYSYFVLLPPVALHVWLKFPVTHDLRDNGFGVL
jgi:hypothetical protein